MKNSQKIIFYFDFISPYVYMAWKPFVALAERNKVDIECVPVLFAGLLNASGQKGPAEIPAKREYVWTEMFRWGILHDTTVKGPPTHPFNPLPSLRICEAVEDPALKLKLGTALTKACWEEGKDISDLNVLKELADRSGLDGAKLLAKIQDPAIKQRIKQNTDDAIAKGVFGVPTFRVGQEIFWGHDRLDQLEKYLRGELNIDEKLFHEMLGRPRAVDRKQIG